MNTMFWADGHVDHLKEAIRRGFNSVEEFQAAFRTAWEKNVTPRTTVICVGDMALKLEGLSFLKTLPGKKILVMGNHDNERGPDIRDLLEVYDDIKGFWKHPSKKMFIGHCPSHPSELRGKLMVHGHKHNDIIKDPRYVNVCWDLLPNGPVDFEDIITGKYRSYRGEVNETV